jgi:hypothetical protein
MFWFGLFSGCSAQKKAVETKKNLIKFVQNENKIIVYQVFTVGNKNTNNKPWGTIEENGVGSL